jgi:hypothetical protein
MVAKKAQKVPLIAVVVAVAQQVKASPPVRSSMKMA